MSAGRPAREGEGEAEPAGAPPLLTLVGARCDLGFAAARVHKVLERRDLGARQDEVVDLFALIGEGTRDAGRVVVVTRAGGGELLVRAPGAIAVVTPRALLPLPRIVTRHAPFLVAVAERAEAPEAPEAPEAGEPGLAAPGPAARPLFVVAEELVGAALAELARADAGVAGRANGDGGGADNRRRPVSKISGLW